MENIDRIVNLIVNIERNIAIIELNESERRDPDKIYNLVK